MGKCINHPGSETPHLCMEHKIYLCEECLACTNPEIKCQCRPACSIWYLTRTNRKKRILVQDADGFGFQSKGIRRYVEDLKPGPNTQSEEKASARQTRLKVNFASDGKTVDLPPGKTLLEAARQADVHLNASCNGKGACGKCKLVVTAGRTDHPSTPLLTDTEKEKGYILACQSALTDDVIVDTPPETRQRKLKAAGLGHQATQRLNDLVDRIEPMLTEISLELAPPSREDSMSDLDRLNRGLKKQGCDETKLNVGIDVIRQLAESVRKENWKLTAAIVRQDCVDEIVEVLPGKVTPPSYGLAIDLGTTTIVVYLVNMTNGEIEAATSGHNRQASCGDDVINRMICAEKDGVEKLSRMVLATINGLVGEILDSTGTDTSQVKNIALSGNTTMTHLLLQIEPSYIRREPYIPTVSEFPILKAGEIGLKANPRAAVFIMPSPASYVGGDIVSGVLYSGFHREDPLTVFIDVGTNGEIVIGNREWLMTAACSAGPAFEGGGIRWGMRAEEGAIETVVIDPDTLDPKYTTVGGKPPRGICGSGMIDLISELLCGGVIDRSGRFRSTRGHPRILTVKNDPVYLLVPADQTPMNEDIVFSVSDIKSLIYSKGAVYSGFTTLLAEAGLDISMVQRMIIAGGFGQYLNIEKAVSIGLLPDIPRSRFTYTGNSSIAGAYMALLSNTCRQEAHQIGNTMTYIDFSSNNRYMDEFISALFLPHTDLNMFPSAM